MIDLDHRLLYDARRLITGENVHRMKELIFAYEQAVSLHKPVGLYTGSAPTTLPLKSNSVAGFSSIASRNLILA